MSEVRSSDLETGLSSSDDRVVSKATSISTPYKAWNSSCSLSKKDEKWIRDIFQFPDFVKIRILSDEERACTYMLMRFVSTRLILPVAFVSLFVLLLGNFFPICILLRCNWCLTLGESLFFAWWYGYLPIRVMSLRGMNSSIFIV